MNAEVTTITEVSQWLRGLDSLTGTPPAFDFSRVPHEPVTLFLDWIREAERAGTPEPHAATLATVGQDGLPDARTLIMKNVTESGWAFAGPLSARKASQLASNPVAALNFWWQPLSRAVRVRGSVVQASRAEIEADLAARPITTVSDDWMLWWIRPVRVEFWQGHVSRNHTRLVYELDGGHWAHRVIAGEHRE